MHLFIGTRWARVLCVLMCIVTAPGCPNLPEPEPQKITVLVVVLDVSDGVAVSPAGRCSEFVARLQQTVEQAQGEPVHLYVLATPADGGIEPELVFGWRTISEARAGYLAGKEAREAARHDQLLQLHAACVAAIGTEVGTSSPLLAAASRAIEALGAHCQRLERGGEEACDARHLAIHSDGLETSDREVRRALKRARRGKSLEKLDLPVLNTADIVVEFTGLSQTLEDRSKAARRAKRGAVEEVWRRVLPGVTFSPTSPKFATSPPPHGEKR